MIPLNINLIGGIPVYSPPFILPPCSDFSLQIFSGMNEPSPDNTVVSLQQSNDGINFDPVVDLSGNNVQIEINSATPTSTLNVSNLCTVWLRLLINPHAAEDGSVSYVILTSN
jgi:hypothetical protein